MICDLDQPRQSVFCKAPLWVIGSSQRQRSPRLGQLPSDDRNCRGEMLSARRRLKFSLERLTEPTKPRKLASFPGEKSDGENGKIDLHDRLIQDHDRRDSIYPPAQDFSTLQRGRERFNKNCAISAVPRIRGEILPQDGVSFSQVLHKISTK